MSQPPQPPDAEGPQTPAGTAGLDAATTHLGVRDPDTHDPRASEVPDSEHDPSLEGLGSRLRSGAKFASVALVFTQVISLAQTIVVARILSPAEIGTFTLGTIFANFLTTLTDGGMRAALIQRGRQIEDAANTVFWVGLVTGTAMSLVALASAPLLALYFDDRLVGLICAATCGTLLIHSLLNVPEALMQRRFNFKRRLIVDPTTASTFALVTVTLALLGFGVWGMVIGLYASQLATLVACWALAGWRPGKGRFVFRIWREMAGYAGPLIVSSVVDQAREAVQSALVGGRLDVASAGQYRYGRRIAILPGQAIIQVASYVLFPAFARIAVDVTRFRDGLLRSLRMLWVATTPFAAVLVALGQPLIVVLLGEQWRPAGLFVTAMAGFGPGVAMAAIGMESIKGAGRSQLINWLTVLSIVVGIGGLVLLLPYGLLGVGLAASIDSLVGGVVALLLARRLAGVSLGDLARVLTPPLVAATVAAGVVGYLEHGVVHADQQPVVIGMVFLALEGLLLLGIFGGLLYLMAPDAIRELRDGVLRRRGGDGDDGDDGDGDGDGDGDTGGPTGPPPDDQPEFLDAPTEVLPILGLYGPTEQVYSPFRPAMAAPRPALPRRVAPPARPPRPTPAPTSTGADDRARRFESVGLDAPTTAIPPTPAPETAEVPAAPKARVQATVRKSSRATPSPDTAPDDGTDDERDEAATETMATRSHPSSGPAPAGAAEKSENGENGEESDEDVEATRTMSARSAADADAADGSDTTRTLSAQTGGAGAEAPDGPPATETIGSTPGHGTSNGSGKGEGKGKGRLVPLVEVPGAEDEAPSPSDDRRRR
ncbi:oligosaccharide flippase family protein [Actinomycetospora lutea]|uniref:oligosaccharide flippase family protein n=1 Tax=Actinomycetospora lutea TaxID=663604 RepID=UPI00236639D9|nr:oligosaccharide flippase family protein [Actinomycetospora lutea]MDD7940815.1 oligosaccharide flippase family protein [Actinomycetospora lutea]